MEDLGKTIAWLGKAMNAHKNSYPKGTVAEGKKK